MLVCASIIKLQVSNLLFLTAELALNFAKKKKDIYGELYKLSSEPHTHSWAFLWSVFLFLYKLATSFPAH